MGSFWRKRPEEKVIVKKEEASEKPNLLEKCVFELDGLTRAQQSDLYNDLSKVFPLHREKIESSYDEAISKARGFLSKGNNLWAGIWYSIATGIAFYDKTIDEVVMNLKNDKMVRPERKYETILKFPEKTWEATRKYISQYKPD
jgi:hypothetical protein